MLRVERPYDNIIRSAHGADFAKSGEFLKHFNMSPEVVDEQVLDRAVDYLGRAGVELPTLSQLANPATLSAERLKAVAKTDPGAPDPANLWRVHWFNDATGTGMVDVPAHLVLPQALTGVKAKIVVALGNRFPMIGAHKVLAAYGCLHQTRC